MRKLFSKKKKDDPIHPEITGSPTRGSVFTAIPQASQVKSGDPFRSQGDELAEKNDWNGAVVMYNAALRSAPDDLSLLLSRSMAHSMSAPPRLDLALKDADAVIQLNPNWWQGWRQKGE